jgi:hypothetical protein
MLMLHKKIYTISLFGCLSVFSFGQKFLKINQSNLPLKYYFDGDSLQKSQPVYEFYASDLITLGEYKLFLKALRKDSGEVCYQKHLPSADTYEEEMIAKYRSSKEFDAYPVIGISWDNAQDYCQWIGRKNKDGAAYDYRLPNVTEWLVLSHSVLREELSVDSLFSEWTGNEMDEAMFGYCKDHQLTFAPGSTTKNPSDIEPLLNRKIVLGNSFMERFALPIDASMRSYFANEGYKSVSFRIVRVKK